MLKGPRLVVRALLPSLLLLGPHLAAQEGHPTTAEPFASIEQEYDAAYQAWMTSYREASRAGASKEAIAEIMATRPDAAAYADRVAKVLEAQPATADGASAAIWLIRVARAKDVRLGLALETLAEHHLDSEKLKDVMLSLSRTPAPAVSRFLTKAHAASDSLENRGQACFALGQHLKTKAGAIRSLADANETVVQRYLATIGREAVDVLKAADADAAEQKAAKCFEEVIANEDFAKLDYFRGTLGQQAERTLFELRNLSIGKVAPEIIGEDIDGAPMKLSDYRGKVVVIDFWGDW